MTFPLSPLASSSPKAASPALARRSCTSSSAAATSMSGTPTRPGNCAGMTPGMAGTSLPSVEPNHPGRSGIGGMG